MPNQLRLKKTPLPQIASLLSKENLPTMYDLPSEDPKEPGLPDEFHYYQPQLLRETFCPPNYPWEQVLVASDLNLYYDVHHHDRYKRPDWFAVLGVPRFYNEQELRMSYVIWQEEVVPLVVVELLSKGTKKDDLGQTLRDVKQPPTKWEVYERILRIPYYIVYGRQSDDFQVFQQVEGYYQELTLPEKRLWIPEINLGLGLWSGNYQGLERQWLRWYDTNREWITTPQEQIEQEKQQALHEKQRADQLAAQLRALGIEPNV